MIAEFFANREIFITGGSGVLGKALIEKLLRSCNIKKIYVLLRSKKTASIEERLEKMKQQLIFRQLRRIKPRELDEKLVAIPGDVIKPRLGITSEYEKQLQNVSLVFHCAATVRFDETLRDAIKLNVGGTFEALKFAETLKHLQLFMHVSTFFSNPYLERVEEKVYKSPMDWKFLLNLIERQDISEEQLNVLTRKLIVGFPNTYCFTKNVTEAMVNDYRHKLPVAIYRPSIVIFALEEPVPGYAPTLTGIMGLFAVTGAGVFKTLYAGTNARLDLTPQDLGVKSLCFYTMKSVKLYENKMQPLAEIPVYHSSSCTHSDFLFSTYVAIIQDYGFLKEAAFEKNLLLPYLQCTNSRFVYLFLFFLKQLLVALLADCVIILSGRQPALMRVQRRIYNTVEALKPFLFNNYESNGTTDSEEILNTTQGTEFSIEGLKIGNDYNKTLGVLRSSIFCIREHLMKEDAKTLPRSRKILKIKAWIYDMLKIIVLVKVFNKVMDYVGHIYYEKMSGNGNINFYSNI